MVYIKVYSDYHKIGLKGIVKVEEKSSLIVYLFKKDLLKLIIPFLMILIGGFFLVAAFRRKGNLHYVFFAAFLLVFQNVFVARTYIKSFIYDNPLFWLDLRLISLYLVPVLFTIFIERFLGVYRKTFRIIWMIHLILFVIILYSRLSGIANVQSFYAIFDIILFMTMLIVSVVVVLSTRSHKDNKILAIGFVTFMLSAIVDVFVTLKVLPYQDYVAAQYGLFFLILCIFTVHFNRYAEMYRDIERYSEEINETNKELVRLNKVKDEFLANTSHELRTPLNGIIGLAQTLLDEASASARQSLGIIIQNGKRLNLLINDILDINKAKNEELKIEKNVFNVHTAVENVFTLLAPLKKKTVQFINETDNVSIYADEERFLQVLNNLIGNAIKFTDQGYVKVSSSYKEGELTLIVKDTGKGIAPEYLDSIFDEFYQEDASLSKKNGGAGLGLSISKRILEGHAGQIGVESTVGKGSTFSCLLPTPVFEHDAVAEVAVTEMVETEMTGVERENGDHTIIHPEKATLLIVDDDEINLKVINSFLGKIEPWHVVNASNGEEALEQAEKIYPDLVLLDIMMPGLDGYEVCQRLRSAPPVEDLKIIFLTAKGMEESQKGYDVGADEYLTKPIDRNELINRINAHLQARWFLRKERQEAFSERQIEFLKLAYEHPNDCKDVIASRMFTNVETLKKDIQKINHVLKTKNFIEAALVAKQRNII